MSIYFECTEDKKFREQIVLQKIDEWIHSDALGDIIKSFGKNIPKSNNLKNSIEWLLKFSDEWDYRRKQQDAKDDKTNEAARWLVNDNEITQKQKAAVLGGIEKLGFVGVDTPCRRNYNYIVALGGARLSCLLRPRYAYEIMKKYFIAPKAIIMLSGFRPIADSEREATDTYAKNAETEFDLICRGAEQCFGISAYEEERHDDININSSWAMRTYKNNPPVIVIAAPSTAPDKRRANTSDTYKFFFEKYQVAECAKLLFITSQIYVPYQQLEAVRTLAIPNNIFVETIGFPNSWSGNLQGMQQSSSYLQE
ncbi:MAG: hypothetical protein LBI03_10840, partial [Clostridiales bacterium]|nr:hypothetical protein [Clostridiales bacterium]